MGHVVFIILHLVAVLFTGATLLFITIPAHIIYGVVSKRDTGEERPTPETHVRCPDCKELVRKDAVKCKHCGCKLVPQE